MKLAKLDIYSNSFLEYTHFKDEYRCLCTCMQIYTDACTNVYIIKELSKFDKILKERLLNTYKFFNHGNNKFILLLRKGVYPYENMDDWEKFNETLLPEKEDFYFYSHLNMEDVTDADYMHTKRVFKVLK